MVFTNNVRNVYSLYTHTMTCVLQYAFEMTSELICQSCYLAFLDCALKLSAAATMTRCVLSALHSLFFCFMTLVLFW